MKKKSSILPFWIPLPDPEFAYLVAGLFVLGALLNTHYGQYFMYGFAGHESNLKFVGALIFAGLFAGLGQLKYSPEHILTIPQGTLIYRLRSPYVDFNSTDQSLTNLLAKNHDVDPKKYQQTVGFKFVSFNRNTEKPPAPGKEEVELELDDSH